MKSYAYINPNESQDMSHQLNKMMQYNCDEFFIEDKQRKQNKELDLLLMKVKKGDCVIIADINVLGMSFSRLKILANKLFESGVKLVSIDDQWESTEILTFDKVVSLFAQVEKRQIMYDTIRKRRKAKERGKEWGRPVIPSEIVHEIRFLYEYNQLTMREIANECNVSLGTVHKYVKKNKMDSY